MAPGAGTPYHRLARRDRHRWWRPVVGTVLLAISYLLVVLLFFCGAMGVGLAVGVRTDADGLPFFGAEVETALLLVTLALALPAVLLTALLMRQRPVGTVSSVTGRVRWRWLGVCLCVALAFVALLIGLDLALTAVLDDDAYSGLSWVGWPRFVASAAMLVVLVPLQAAAEEYVCRGWLLQAVGAYVRSPWLPIGVQAVVFGAAHGWGTSWGFLALLVFGTATGWLAVRTGGLEAGIALHALTNLIAFLFLAALGDLDAEETLADAPWHTTVVDAVVVCLYAAVVARLARNRRLDTVVPDPPPWTTPPTRPSPSPPMHATQRHTDNPQPDNHRGDRVQGRHGERWLYPSSVDPRGASTSLKALSYLAASLWAWTRWRSPSAG